METTDQVNKKAPNPTGKGGFKDNPEHRNPGGWKKTQTFRYWYEIFKAMTVKDFLAWEDKTPEEEKSMVASTAYRVVNEARVSLKALQEVADRSEGKAPQTLIHEGGLFLESKLKILEADDNPDIEQEAEVDPESTGRSPDS